MSTWFECKVRYDKIQENGSAKKVNEPYLVDALSFTEAEARIIEEKTAVEKKTTSHILVAANDFRGALDHFMEGMKGTMADFEVSSIAETQLMDVYKAKLEGQTAE